MIAANDGLGGAVISALESKYVPAKTVPVIGQDVKVAGLQGICSDPGLGAVCRCRSIGCSAVASLPSPDSG